MLFYLAQRVPLTYPFQARLSSRGPLDQLARTRTGCLWIGGVCRRQPEWRKDCHQALDKGIRQGHFGTEVFEGVDVVETFEWT